ncbi:MAG TPA: hypothetical protein VLM38_17035 [Blastocatellia bacterium]|nr:hypothetical protein [Blastocatellia bacterium]
MATSSVDAPILVVAALGRELARLRSAMPSGVALLETGEGVLNAERNLETWLARGPARAVLSIGFAGALTGSLKAGDLVIAREVRDAPAKPDTSLLQAAESIGLTGSTPRFGLAVTSDEILWQAESKRKLANTLNPNEIGFVDTESTAIAGVCGRRGVPFLIVRSITDLLEEDLPLNFNLYRDSEGRVDSNRVLKATLLKPSAIAALLELRNRSELCAKRMAGFVRCLVPFIDRVY